jgi:murein L,D-transpeptidase YcbB/YkuD
MLRPAILVWSRLRIHRFANRAERARDRTRNLAARVRRRSCSALLLLLAVLDVSSTRAADVDAAVGIRAALAGWQQPSSEPTARPLSAETLRSIYAARAFSPLWLRNGAFTLQAMALLHLLRSADRYGLNPGDYVAGLPDATTLPGPAAASFDVALSSATVRFLTDLHFGRVDPRAAGFNLTTAPPPLDLPALMGQLANSADVEKSVGSIEPQFYHYGLLKQALARYRLLATGAATPTPAELQTRPYAVRVRQIELTLERWRWLPSFESPPIIVNIPQFRLFAFRSIQDRKADILQMDVIVGRTFPKARTPVFAADMKYVIFRPYWDVPYSITQREMLPKIRANPDYLRTERLQIVVRGADDTTASVLPPTRDNIAALAAGTLRLRQQPGANNALGLVKFMLPNPYDVYLHSTPTQQLFGRSRRAFSHGCIRVSDPIALAAQVLNNAPGEWTRGAIEAAMNGTATVRVNLSRPIRVMILYGTALATEDGGIMFFDDLYGHDRRLEKLLGLAPIVGG